MRLRNVFLVALSIGLAFVSSACHRDSDEKPKEPGSVFETSPVTPHKGW